MADYYGYTCIKTRRQYLVGFFPCRIARRHLYPGYSLYELYIVDLVLVMPYCRGSYTPMQFYFDAVSRGSLLNCCSRKYATQVKQYDDDVETAISAAWCASAALHIVKTLFCSLLLLSAGQ